MMNTTTKDPYIGPRSFQRNESHLFFGRDREARDLTALVLTEKLVLFYAQSGAGKSSLINTSLIPALEKNLYEVLPIARVIGDMSERNQVDNIYIYNLMRSLIRRDMDTASVARLTLPQFMGRLNEDEKGYFYDSGLMTEIRGPAIKTPWRRALIIDQFEELFSTNADVWEKREGFFRQLSQAMQADPYLWVILIMREDYIAALDPYTHLMPGGLDVRYYMQRLTHEAAIQAVRSPVKDIRPYAKGVAEKLVDDLSSVKVEQLDGSIINQPGQFIEPVQLQVVCSNLWGKLPAETAQITQEELDKYVGKVDEALGEYYAERVLTIAEGEVAKQKGVREREIREWFGRKLITTNGIRNMVAQERGRKSGSLNDDVIQEFTRRADLVRAEKRGGTTFYELTHDRLIEPILENNRKWQEKHTNLLERGAILWEEQGRSTGLLLRGKELSTAEKWASANPDQMDTLERKYLEACIQARSDARERVRFNQRIRKTMIVAIIVAVMAGGFMVLAGIFGVQAYQKDLTSEAQNLAYQSEAVLQPNNESSRITAATLAYQALKYYPYTGEAEYALGRVISSPSYESSFSIQSNRVLDVTLSQDNSKITTISDDGSIQEWNTSTSEAELLSTINIQGPVTMAVFSPDGLKVMTSSHDNLTHLWDVGTGKDLAKIDDYVTGASFSEDGTWVVTSATADARLRVWSTATGKLLSELSQSAAIITSNDPGPNGSHTLSFDTSNIPGVWDIETGEKIFSLSPRDEGIINTVTFSLDGLKIAGVVIEQSTKTYTMNLWESSVGQSIWSEPLLPPKIYDFNDKTDTIELFFSPDGSQIIAAVSGESFAGFNPVYVWNTATGEKLFTLSGNTKPITKAAFSPDGLRVAAASNDQAVRLWDIENFDQIWDSGNRDQILFLQNKFNSNSNATKILFSKDNSHILTLWDDGTVELINIAPSLKKLLSSAEGICGACEPNYRQRLRYGIRDWSMVIYDNRNYFFASWTAFFYIILIWITYNKVFANKNRVSTPQSRGFTLSVFFLSSLAAGTILALFMIGFISIAMAELIARLDEPMSDVRTFGISPILFLTALPVLIWPGGIYTHMTRFQSGRGTRFKRVLISAVAGLLGLVVVSFITFIGLIFYGLLTNSGTGLAFTVLMAGLLNIFIGGPTNLAGSLLYIFGLQPLAERWQKHIQMEDEV